MSCVSMLTGKNGKADFVFIKHDTEQANKVNYLNDEKEEKEREELNRTVFGYDRNISLLIMNYIGDIKTLFAVSKVNKLLRETIDEEMVIKCAMYNGGRPFESIRNIYRFMKSKSGYIASPLRLLRLCNGKRCEFCNNTETNDICEFRGKDVSNIRPAVVRPHMNVFACIACLTAHRNSNISQNWGYDCLTRKFERKIWSDHKQSFFENGYYLAYREILYKIFSHPRVTSYPYGKRWVYMDNDGVIQNAFGVAHFEATDRYELQFACAHIDACGEAIGPLFNRAMLPSLVSYLQKSNNRGIDYFLEHMIPNAPKVTDYNNFVNTYEKHIELAIDFKKKKDEKILANRVYRRYVWVEHVVRAIGEIVSYIRPSVLSKEFEEYARINSKERGNVNRSSLSYKHKWGRDIDKQQVFSMVIRTVLCYYEATEITLKRPVSYCTGSSEINHILNKTLQPLYKDPIRVIGSRSIAKRIAKTLFTEITNSADWLVGVSREVTDIRGNVRHTFKGRTSGRFRHMTFSRKIAKWTDTSDNRNP